MRLRVDFSVETLERRSLMEAETDGGDGGRLDGCSRKLRMQQTPEAGPSRVAVSPTGFRDSGPADARALISNLQDCERMLCKHTVCGLCYHSSQKGTHPPCPNSDASSEKAFCCLH